MCYISVREIICSPNVPRRNGKCAGGWLLVACTWDLGVTPCALGAGMVMVRSCALCTSQPCSPRSSWSLLGRAPGTHSLVPLGMAHHGGDGLLGPLSMPFSHLPHLLFCSTRLFKPMMRPCLSSRSETILTFDVFLKHSSVHHSRKLSLLSRGLCSSRPVLQVTVLGLLTGFGSPTSQGPVPCGCTTCHPHPVP